MDLRETLEGINLHPSLSNMPKHPFAVQAHKWSDDELDSFCPWRDESLQNGKIVPIPAEYVVVACQIFPAILGSEKKYRIIYDGPSINKYLMNFTLRLPSAHKMGAIFKPNAIVCTVDLKQSYFQMDISNRSKQFCCFMDPTSSKEDPKFFCFTGLPFGISRAPKDFTRKLKPLVNFLNSIGFPTEAYLDDLIINLGDDTSSPEEISKKWNFIIWLFDSLKIRLNKKIQKPTTFAKFLGKLLDFKMNLCIPPEDKVNNIISLATTILNSQHTNLHTLASLKGKMNFCFPDIITCLSFEYDLFIGKKLLQYYNEPNTRNLSVPAAWKLSFPTPNGLKLLIIQWISLIPNNLWTHMGRFIPSPLAINIITDASTSHIGGWTDFNDSKLNFYSTPLPPDKASQSVSSMTREAWGTLAYLEYLLNNPILTSNPSTPISIWNDNLGLIFTLKNRRFKRAQIRPILARIYKLCDSLPNPISFHWHPRTSLAAIIADDLSKPLDSYSIDPIHWTNFILPKIEKVNSTKPRINNLPYLNVHDLRVIPASVLKKCNPILPQFSPEFKTRVKQLNPKLETTRKPLLNHSLPCCASLWDLTDDSYFNKPILAILPQSQSERTRALHFLRVRKAFSLFFCPSFGDNLDLLCLNLTWLYGVKKKFVNFPLKISSPVYSLFHGHL
jgi:hypothetical protein